MHSCNSPRGSFSPTSAPAHFAALCLVMIFAVHGPMPIAAQQKNAPAVQNSGRNEARSERSTAKALPIKEDELRQRFEGKTLYLRGGYFQDELRFDVNGHLEGSAQQLPYTLSMIEISKVHLSKHKVELDGLRYGVHFLEDRSVEDPIAASDKVRITPKKKTLRIEIERAEVVKPKKGQKLRKNDVPANTTQGAGAAPNPTPSSDNAYGMTQEHANELLRTALDNVFSRGLDERMIASLPDYWRLYYHALASKATFKPSDPAVLHENAVDQKARLLTNFEPPSNDFAQAAGVAGVAQYHVVVGADGKPGEIAVGRPIGFGLDENAIASIRKAMFAPAMKGGKPVPVVVDLFVQFRIYSTRTGPGGATEAGATGNRADGPSLPGPYSAEQPAAKPQ
jgi:hypothetical protein